MTVTNRLNQPALPERISGDDILRQHSLLAEDEGFCTLVDAMPELVMVLGSTRQVVMGNRALTEFAAREGHPDFLGMRPGEIFSCGRALTAPSGCGTDEACTLCGAVEAILAALAGNKASCECRMLRSTPHGLEALELKVWGTPLRWQGQDLALVVAVNISDEKRRKILEKLFFHDLLNTAGALSSLAELLFNGTTNFDDVKESLLETAQALVGEIRSQRELLAAENSELSVQTSPLHTRLFLERIAYIHGKTTPRPGQQVLLDDNLVGMIFHSDERLIYRVMGNLVKNALEASPEDGVVMLGCRLSGEEISFWCHNQGVIPDVVRLQIFQRSYSTKGAGRGMGTYSVKLLTERYLQGRVEFVSDEKHGTIFTVTYPVELQTPDQ